MAINSFPSWSVSEAGSKLQEVVPEDTEGNPTNDWFIGWCVRYNLKMSHLIYTSPLAPPSCLPLRVFKTNYTSGIGFNLVFAHLQKLRACHCLTSDYRNLGELRCYMYLQISLTCFLHNGHSEICFFNYNNLEP